MAKPKVTTKKDKASADEKLDTMLNQAAEIYKPEDGIQEFSESIDSQVDEKPAELAVLDDLVGITIPCPQHGEDYPIKIQQEAVEGGYKLFAKCDCAVRNNMWRDKVVWEKTISKPSTVSNTEGV